MYTFMSNKDFLQAFVTNHNPAVVIVHMCVSIHCGIITINKILSRFCTQIPPKEEII